MATDQGDVDQHMQRNSGKEEIPNKKDWISADTVNKVQVRKEKKGAVNNSRTSAAKATAQEAYIEANRAVKNSVTTDKENFIEDLSIEAEDASAQRNMK